MDKVTNRLFTQCNFPEWNKQKIHCKCESLNNLPNVLLRNLNIENVYNFMLYGKQNWYYKAMEDVRPENPILYKIITILQEILSPWTFKIKII